MSYSDIVLDHFYRPRNQFRMENADLRGVAGDPTHGNFMVLFFRVDGERIVAASFQTHGCCPSIAAGSLLAESLPGSTRQAAAAWTEARINEELGGLPIHKRYCSALAATALRDAVQQWRADTRKKEAAHGNCAEPHS
jgi:nitrogen fixation NifU-like protein